MTLQSPKQKRRGLKGGLDNAIRQAEERGFYKMQIIDSDCHQMEPFLDFAKYCEEPYKTMLLARDPEADPWFAKRLKSQVQPFGPKIQTQHAMKGIKFL
ncbi:MAG: hypothetical protein JRN67_00615, partial [Nitrososphaerota archaeon]|nr:hypothetical protein [Nitrososphaerota archaeon]